MVPTMVTMTKGSSAPTAATTAGDLNTATTTTTTSTVPPSARSPPLPSPSSPRALEFYCGVGGLHYSLLRARPTATVAAAFDINPNSNDVYEHNFGVRPWQKNLFGKRKSFRLFVNF